ncbi:unnamed protein product, partial [Menidia menidia]
DELAGSAHYSRASRYLSASRTQIREPANGDGAPRRFSAFSEVLDRSDFRLREFKMAATGSK